MSFPASHPNSRRPGRSAFLATLLATALSCGTTTLAAEEADAAAQAEQERVTRTGGLRQEIYERMQEIQVLIESDQLPEARAALSELQERKLSDYELAQTYYMLGYAHFQEEDFPAAEAAFERVLVNKELPQGLQANVLRTLAQLSMIAGAYEAALERIDALLAMLEIPQANSFPSVVRPGPLQAAAHVPGSPGRHRAEQADNAPGPGEQKYLPEVFRALPAARRCAPVPLHKRRQSSKAGPGC
ncbi:MAG: hypothetical protein AAGH19_11355, partial [Pseudomonadota bacterium]